MTDSQLVDSAIASLSRFGFNADRANFEMIFSLALEYGRDSSKRLEAIASLVDLSIDHGNIIKHLIINKEVSEMNNDH